MKFEDFINECIDKYSVNNTRLTQQKNIFF